MKNFKTYELAISFFNACLKLKLRGTLRNQLERASSSIALNLSEGRGRKTLADQKHFFQIAYGSARECKAILELADLKKDVVYCMADNICAHIYRLIQNAK